MANAGAARRPCKRPRAQVQAKDLATLLRPYCAGVTWLQYAEAFADAVDPSKVTKHKDLLHALQGAQGNLLFKQKDMAEAFLDIARERTQVGDWDLREAEAHDWAVTMGRRVRAMCRHVAQAIVKSPRTPWLRLLELPPAASGTPAVPAQVAAPVPEEVCFFGVDDELQKAWRVRAGGGQRELCARMDSPAGAAASDAMVATWAEGTQRPVPGLSVQRHAAVVGARAVAATGEADLHWKAEHPQTRHTVSVTKKRDRQVLIVINEQRKQVCQLTVESFFDNTPAGERLAFDVMREVAQEFVAGKLEGKAELAARRDAILAARGHARRGRKMRRPAAGR